MSEQHQDRRAELELKKKIATLEVAIETLEFKIDKLTSSVDGLVVAWNTAKGVTAFVKWIGSISVGLGVLWAMLHGGIK